MTAVRVTADKAGQIHIQGQSDFFIHRFVGNQQFRPASQHGLISPVGLLRGVFDEIGSDLKIRCDCLPGV